VKNISGLPKDVLNEEQPDRKFIEALARGLEVLRAFKPGDGFLGNLEISRRTNIPKSTVSRLTYTLTKLGYLTYSDQLEKYQLGSGVLALGYAFVSSLAIRQVAKPLMTELAESTDTGIGLANRDRLSMIHLEFCAPTETMTFIQEIGDRVGIARSSSGRAYLAALPEQDRNYFMGLIKDRSGDDWSQVEKGINDAVKSYETQGFCYSWGDFNPDVIGIAVPLVLSPSNIFTFSAGGPSFRLTPEYLTNEVAPLLKTMVGNIEATVIRY